MKGAAVETLNKIIAKGTVIIYREGGAADLGDAVPLWICDPPLEVNARFYDPPPYVTTFSESKPWTIMYYSYKCSGKFEIFFIKW